MNLKSLRHAAVIGVVLPGALASVAVGLQSEDSERIYPPSPPEADSMMVLVDAAHNAEAESLGWVFLEELEASKGPESFEVSRVLDTLAEARLRQRDRSGDSTTVALIDRALVIKTAMLGSDHPEIARTIGLRAKLITDQGDLEGAIEIRMECLAILRKDPGPDKGMLAAAAAQTGILYGMLARYEEATPFLEEALEAYTETYGPNHIEAAASCHNVGNIYYMRGDYEGAQTYYSRTLAAYEATLDPDHPRIMIAHYALGSVARNRGDYAGSREHYEKGMQLAEGRDGPDSPQLVRFLRGLSNLESDLGNTEEALALQKRSLAISEAQHGPDSFEIIADLTNLGISYRLLRQFEDARTLLVRAIAVGTERSPEHDQLALPLAQLGRVERAEGNHQAAVDTLLRALAINEKVLGPTHDQTGQTHAYLAAVYEDMGNYAEAEPHLDAAIEAFESGWRDQQFYALCLLQRARVRLATERFDAAFEDAWMGEKNARAHYLFTLRSLGGEDALAFSAFRGDGIPLMVSLLLLEGKPSAEAVTSVWDDLIRSRGLLLEELSVRHRLVQETGDAEMSELSAAVLDARTRLANLYLRGPESEDLDQFTSRLNVISEEKELAEAEFAVRSAVFRSEEQARAAGFEEISEAIPEDGALVAFVRYPRHRPGDEPVLSYAAFVMSSKTKDPTLVDLGDADRIDQYVTDWRGALASSTTPSGPLAESAEQKVREYGESLREAMLDPILPHLGKSDPVLVVPAGSLHLVNPAALPSGDQGYLVETGPAFHLLPAERTILSRESKTREMSLFAVGGPDFDMSPGSNRTSDALVASGEINTPKRGTSPDCDQFLELEFVELPGAEMESREIAGLWKEAQSGANATILVGSEATEVAFKQAAPDHSVIHVATHGYFLSSECAMERETEPGSEATLHELVQGNPLLLSGLALSGSNQRDQRVGAEDGILTAEEIASLDLDGVDWVVLSACDTGQGEVRAGAGVIGLQRAFQTAGARTVIMSLWAVDDEATRDWMSAMYRARWKDGRATAQSIREASLQMLQQRREAGLNTSPVTWGAFVATGDWR